MKKNKILVGYFLTILTSFSIYATENLRYKRKIMKRLARNAAFLRDMETYNAKYESVTKDQEESASAELFTILDRYGL